MFERRIILGFAICGVSAAFALALVMSLANHGIGRAFTGLTVLGFAICGIVGIAFPQLLSVGLRRYSQIH